VRSVASFHSTWLKIVSSWPTSAADHCDWLMSLTCTTRKTRTHLGDGSFSVAGPCLWNSLPVTLRDRDGSKLPKITQKGAWIGVFKPNLQNIKTGIILKLLHWFQPNFAQWQKPTNTLREWSKYTQNKSKMADSRHLQRLKNGHVCATFRPINTKFGFLVHIGPMNWTGS